MGTPSSATSTMLLPADEFCDALRAMYARNVDKGSVWLTFKRSQVQRKGTKVVDRATVCLVRASDGKRKLSTHIAPDAVVEFRARLDAVVRESHVALADSTKKSAHHAAE